MSGHTPGPWAACKDGDCPCGMVWSKPADFNVATAHIRSPCDEREMWDKEMSAEERRANARLIAAAPKLLDACKVAAAALDKMASTASVIGIEGTSDWDHLAGGSDLFGTLDELRAAIAKAEQP